MCRGRKGRDEPPERGKGNGLEAGCEIGNPTTNWTLKWNCRKGKSNPKSYVLGRTRQKVSLEKGHRGDGLPSVRGAGELGT